MKKLNKETIILSILTMIVGIALGWLFFGKSSVTEIKDPLVEVTKNQIWTCAMHPSVRQNEPGKCPICGMELIPLESSHSEENPMNITMSSTAMKLANIQTMVIRSQKPIKEVRLTGKVQADEQKVYSQTSHLSGRVEKLLINITGEYVRKGQEIAYIYSPELVTAQKELFEAFKIRDSQPELYNASREKLKNWKLTDPQIDGIIQSGKPNEQFPILADINGVVTSKSVNLGDYVKQGSVLYEIADLSRLWILFDVYESDMSWVKTGNEVEYTVQSLPGQSFSGKISFIDPVIHPKTRVAKARIVVPNSDLILKPEMFVSGVIKSPVQKGKESIIVPKTAVMWTGKRSVVYVKTDSDVGVAFRMREVTLGPSLGESYVINEGLEVGEEIASYGTFSIDAAAQLAGKPSMMNPEGATVMTSHNHGSSIEKSTNAIETASIENLISISEEAKKALFPVYKSYLNLKDALVSDDFDKVKIEGEKLKKLMMGIDMSIFEGEAHNFWMEQSMPAKKAIDNLTKAKDLDEARKPFKPLSEHMIQLANKFHPYDKVLYIQHCPMADDNKGADWLSADESIKNPYYGQSMLSCGEVTKEIK